MRIDLFGMKKFFEREGKGLLFVLIVLFICVSFQDYLLELFDRYIVPYFDIKTSLLTKILFICIVSVIFVRLIYKTIKNKYLVDYWFIIFLTLLCLVICEISNKSILKSENRLFSYIHILLFFLIIYVAILLCVRLFSRRGKYIKENKFYYYNDNPMIRIDNDLLYMESHLETVIDMLNSVRDESDAVKIGLVGEWGEGKSTFLNFVEEKLKTEDFKNQFIIIKFNPRHSENISQIQTDFFNTFNGKLRNYSARFSRLIKVYMNAIGILDRGIILKTIKNQQCKEEFKQNINNALSELKRKIVIIIDDFDRLFKDEVVEVLKLIDGNACFEHTIFITAYDKMKVSSILSEGKEIFFIDKYFTWEFYLPIRPKSLLIDSLQIEFSFLLEPNKIELYQKRKKLKREESYKQFFNEYQFECKKLFLSESWEKYQYHFKRELISYRDINRFLNFIQPYIPYMVREMLSPHDMLLLCLIRFKYPDEYNRLFEKEYFEDNSLSLKKELKDVKSKDILETLFPKRGSDIDKFFRPEKRTGRRSINDDGLFDIYFYLDLLNETIEIGEFTKIFDIDNLSEVNDILQKWKQEGKIKDCIKQISDRKNKIKDYNFFIRYLDVLFLLNTIYPSFDVNYQITDLLLKETSVYISKKIEINIDHYKDEFYKRLSNYNSSNLVREYMFPLLRKSESSDKIIFLFPELQKIAIECLEKYIKGNDNINTGKNGLLPLLYNCIKSINQETKEIKLLPSVCRMVKDVIINYPVGYWVDFVGLGAITSDPEYNIIACEPHWHQIFGDNKDEAINFIKDLIDKFDQNVTPKATLIQNFWRLYEKNNYQSIPFEGQGNVQYKIDNNSRRS